MSLYTISPDGSVVDYWNGFPVNLGATGPSRTSDCSGFQIPPTMLVDIAGIDQSRINAPDYSVPIVVSNFFAID